MGFSGTATAPDRALSVQRLGLVDYAAAWTIQTELHAAVAAGLAPPTLLLLEHPPTITLGNSATRAHLLFDEEHYRARGIAVHKVERGGQVTWHGPGQLVGYPIVPVDRVGDFLRSLEQVLIAVASGYGLAATGTPGYAGVWVHGAKLAALGIAVRKRVAFHGFALNVSTDLNAFDLIVPCGQPDARATSLQQLLDAAPPMDEVADRVVDAFKRVPGAMPTALRGHVNREKLPKC